MGSALHQQRNFRQQKRPNKWEFVVAARIGMSAANSITGSLPENLDEGAP
jgi:hypothetical protein